MRKKLKNINEKFNTKKALILAGLHFGFFVWSFRSFLLIYQGQNFTSSLLSSIIWGIVWFLPSCVAAICRGKPKNDKNTQQ